MPLLLLVAALAALFGSNYLSGQLHDDLGEVAADDTVPPGVSTPLISTRRLADLLTPSLTEPDFDATLDELMAAAPASACLNVTLDNRDFYVSGANTQVMPSDALMLLTIATAHQMLGPDYTFTTSVQSAAPMEDGIVNGDIYLVGGGDPLLLTQGYLSTLDEGLDQLHTPIEELAQQLVDDGLTRLNGAVVGDSSRYDDLRYVPSWPESYIDSGMVGTLLALQFDDGWVQFPTLVLEQVTEEEATDEEAAVVVDDDEEQDFYLAAEDPPFFAAALFDDMLEDRDVVIPNSPRSEAVPSDEEIYLLAAIESAPLSDLYRQILANRDIETVELLLKEIGFVTSNSGSTSAGFRAVGNMLAEAGINADQFRLLQFDGSGLDPANIATCPVFTALLDSEEFSPLFHELLPTAAEAGPLGDLFSDVDNPEGIRALSGGMSGTTVMMGYIDVGLDQEMTFAFIANEQDSDDNRAIRDLANRAVRHLATFTAPESIDDLGLDPIRSG